MGEASFPLSSKGFPGSSAGKESACYADLGSIPELGRSPGEGNGYPLHYSGLEGMATHSTVLAWRIPWTWTV